MFITFLPRTFSGGRDGWLLEFENKIKIPLFYISLHLILLLIKKISAYVLGPTSISPSVFNCGEGMQGEYAVKILRGEPRLSPEIPKLTQVVGFWEACIHCSICIHRY